MIKLIAVDMDGTLLKSDKSMPTRTAEIIKELLKRDVRFVVASGRQYYSLYKDFMNIDSPIIYIAENGAMIFDNQNMLEISEIPYELLKKPVEKIRKLPNTHMVLCGEKTAWIESNDEYFHQNVIPYYAKSEIVSDVLEHAKDDKICKIAVFQHKNAEHGLYKHLTEFEDNFDLALSGDSWVDLMLPSINKGIALKHLQEKLDIKPDECMAFGDYLNDIELMQAVTHSYAMANAHEDLAKICKHTAPSNDDEGVIKVICEYFGI